MGRIASGASTLPQAHLVVSTRMTTGYDRTAVRDAADIGHITVDECSLVRLRDRSRVNSFLEHPVIGHVRGSVPGWLACFGLEYRGDLVAVIVLENPYNPVRDNGAEVYLSRYAAHPFRPSNTASYLISRAREWCRVSGYSLISTNAGISGDNFGTIYQSAGFRYLETVEANGSGWKDVKGGGRDEWEDYAKRQHRYEIGRGLRRYTPKTAKFYEQSAALSGFEDSELARAAESHVAWIEPGETEMPSGETVQVCERFDLDTSLLDDALTGTAEPDVILAGE
jgi:GNAT superfamily N-acetyltransferase